MYTGEIVEAGEDEEYMRAMKKSLVQKMKVMMAKGYLQHHQ
jgi:hypothetical protein